MPGLGLSAGITFFMLTLVVFLPIGALLWQGANFGAANIWATINRERVWAALWLSSGCPSWPPASTWCLG